MAKWGKISSRGRVDDRRGISMSKGGVGVGGIIALLAVGYFAGPETAMQLFYSVQQSGITNEQIQSPDAEKYEGNDAYEEFSSTIIGSNNTFWSELLESGDIPYKEPTLVLFRDYTNSACGGASSAIGPHYCPADQTIYLDETFFRELENRYGAEGGDVAEAYVLAHEVGHHVQNILGVERGRQRTNETAIKIELQADCFAGLWAGSLKGEDILEPGEISEAIDAAEAVGDDRIQEAANGRINPESWTHGSSKQRKEWFQLGYNSNIISTCDTFK